MLIDVNNNTMNFLPLLHLHELYSHFNIALRPRLTLIWEVFVIEDIPQNQPCQYFPLFCFWIINPAPHFLNTIRLFRLKCSVNIDISISVKLYCNTNVSQEIIIHNRQCLYGDAHTFPTHRERTSNIPRISRFPVVTLRATYQYHPRSYPEWYREEMT